MKAFQVKLNNGSIFGAIAHVRTEVPGVLVNAGFANREDIQQITCINNRVNAKQQQALSLAELEFFEE